MTNHIQDAIRAGLSAKAAAVYVCLLESGTALPPKAVVLRTKLHRQYVYDGLYELRDRGLLVAQGSGKRIKYLAATPDRLLRDAEKARLLAQDGVSSLIRLYDRSPAGIVEIVRGSRQVLESELALLRESKQGDFLDIVGGAGLKWVELFGDRVDEWEQLRSERGVVLRYIGSGEDVHYNREKSVIHHESRAIPGIGEIVNVVIRPESVSFNIYEPEIVVVRVRSIEAVASQRALFEVLWKVAN